METRDRFERVLVIAVALLLSGCATGYQEEGFTGGYTDSQLAPDIFRVGFRGNGYTSPQRVQDMVMLRAAELTMQHGFRYFSVLDQSSGGNTSTYTTPGTAHTTGSVIVSGGIATGSAVTTYVPGQTYSFFKPSAGLLIRCSASQSKAGGLTFDASFLSNSVRTKYRIPPRTP